MQEKEYYFIEKALMAQRVTIRRVNTSAGLMLVIRKGGQTIGFVFADEGLHALNSYLFRLARIGRIRWPPDW